MNINDLRLYSIEQYGKSLTEEEKRALKVYSLVGNKINADLRKHIIRKKYIDIVANLDSALKKYECFDDLILYRKLYLYSDEKKVLINRWINTGVMIDKGYLSTTIDTDCYTKEYNVLISIDFPKEKTGAFIRSFSQYKGEEEFLIKRGSVLLIEDNEYDSFNGIHLFKTKLK